jgi:hypothetical protein
MTRHQTFSVPEALPEAKRRAVLDLQVRKSFPFKEPGFAAFWKGAEATVYAWDAVAVRAAQESAGVSRSAQVIPETFIRPRGQNEVRLVAMLDGFEGQFWSDGFLRATRWWANPPTEIDWAKFVRSFGAPNISSTNGVPLELSFLERPWTEGTFSLDDWSSLLKSKRVLTFAAAAALCPFAFLGAEIATLSISEKNIREEIKVLNAANQNVRADRAAAYANLEAIEDFLKLTEYPSQAEVLTTAMLLLAKTGAPRIVSWSFDRGNLEIILRGEQSLDATAYITLFERDPVFENASGTLVGQEQDLQLKMSVTKRALN